MSVDFSFPPIGGDAGSGSISPATIQFYEYQQTYNVSQNNSPLAIDIYTELQQLNPQAQNIYIHQCGLTVVNTSGEGLSVKAYSKLDQSVIIIDETIVSDIRVYNFQSIHKDLLIELSGNGLAKLYVLYTLS